MKKLLCIIISLALLTCTSCGSVLEGIKKETSEVVEEFFEDDTEQGKEEVFPESESNPTGDESLNTEETFEEQINDMEKLGRYVSQELSKGSQEITFVTTELPIDDIQNINHYLDGFYGNVQKCTSQKSIFSDEVTVTLNCTLNDNYYVEAYMLRGEEIPTDHEKAVELASACQQILSEMKSSMDEDASDYRKERWVHDYLVTTVVYGKDNSDSSPDQDAHESYGAIISKEAVCNGYAYAMKLLLDLNDVPCIIVTGTGNGESHAWNMVYLGQHWYHVDVTWDDPSPDQADRIIFTYLNISDDRIALSHEWVRERYPVADSLEYNYYILNDLYCENYECFRDTCKALLKDSSLDRFQVMVADYDPSIYTEEGMNFIFKYTDYRSMNYQMIGEIPYMTIYITLK